jgi:hypothetical protein
VAAPRFFTKEWAEAIREAVNRGPSEDYLGSKLDDYWEWIDNARNSFEGHLGFAISRAEELEPEVVLLAFSGGQCTAAEIANVEAMPPDTFLLAGERDAWRDLMSGYDAGKTVMYRRLLLVQGNLLGFFNRVYFFVELLALVGKVPTDLDELAAA